MTNIPLGCKTNIFRENVVYTKQYLIKRYHQSINNILKAQSSNIIYFRHHLPKYLIPSHRMSMEESILITLYYAFFITPLVTVLLAMLFLSVLDLVFEGAWLSEDISYYKSALYEGLLVAVSYLYITLIVFGLPAHWLLGKINKRKLYFYLLVPAAILSPIFLIMAMKIEELVEGLIVGLIVWGALSGILVVPFGIFWILAVYLPQNRILFLTRKRGIR